MTYMRKESKKGYIYIKTHTHIKCITDSLCCIPETNVTFWINSTPILFLKKRQEFCNKFLMLF